MYCILPITLILYSQCLLSNAAKELLDCFNKNEDRGMGLDRALTELRDVTVYDCLQCCLDITGNHGECCTSIVYHHHLNACELFAPADNFQSAADSINHHSPGTDLYIRHQDEEHKNCSCDPLRPLYTMKPPTTTTESPPAHPPALLQRNISPASHGGFKALPVHVAPPIEFPAELNFQRPLSPSILEAKPPAGSPQYVPVYAPGSYVTPPSEYVVTQPGFTDTLGGYTVAPPANAGYTPPSEYKYEVNSVTSPPTFSGYGGTTATVTYSSALPDKVTSPPSTDEYISAQITTLIPQSVIETDLKSIGVAPETFIRPQENIVISTPLHNNLHIHNNNNRGVSVLETIERINNFQGASNPCSGIQCISAAAPLAIPGLGINPNYALNTGGLNARAQALLQANRFLNPRVNIPQSILQNIPQNLQNILEANVGIGNTHTHPLPQEPFSLISSPDDLQRNSPTRGRRIDPRVTADKKPSDDLSCSGGVYAYFVAIENELVIASDIPVKKWQLEDVDDAVCQRACSNNQLPNGNDVSCAAFNYFPTESRCQLSSLKLYPGRGGRLNPNTDSIFSQKFCLSGDAARSCSAEEVFFLFPQKTIKGYNSFPVPGLKAETLEECMRMCILEPACRSVVYESDTFLCDMKTTDLQQRPDAGKPAGKNTVLAENGCRVNQARLQSLDSSDIEEAFRPFTGKTSDSLISFKSIETSSESSESSLTTPPLAEWNEWSACLFKVLSNPVRVRARKCQSDCPKGSLQVEPCSRDPPTHN